MCLDFPPVNSGCSYTQALLPIFPLGLLGVIAAHILLLFDGPSASLPIREAA